jgi:hypothetical protein
MSRHCLYCAKELPKTATNNFCSKDCWTEYKKLKAMDIGTDKQATVLLKRSELNDSEASGDQPGSEPGFQSYAPSSDPFGESHRNLSSGPDVFEDASGHSSEAAVHAEPMADQGSKEVMSISDRLAALEQILSGKTGAEHVGELPEVLLKKLDELAIRQNKLEVDLEKVDIFLRSADKFEDRIRRLERRIQSDLHPEPVRKRGFFARLFS